tara:strand:- start:1485 stop:2036 length:552 start_codon:yes stop_codon:yes gene_type:complete
MQTIKKHTKKRNPENYSPKKDKSLLFITLAVLGLFVGVLLILGLYSITIISFYTITKLLVGFAILGFLIPLKYYHKWFHFIKYEMIIFNIIGIAPFLTGLLLLLNFTIPLNTTTTDYKIEKIYFDDSQSMVVVLENKIFSEEQRIVESSNKSAIKINGKNALRLTLSKGLFGLDVVNDRELVN